MVQGDTVGADLVQVTWRRDLEEGLAKFRGTLMPTTWTYINNQLYKYKDLMDIGQWLTLCSAIMSTIVHVYIDLCYFILRCGLLGR